MLRDTLNAHWSEMTFGYGDNLVPFTERIVGLGTSAIWGIPTNINQVKASRKIHISNAKIFTWPCGGNGIAHAANEHETRIDMP